MKYKATALLHKSKDSVIAMLSKICRQIGVWPMLLVRRDGDRFNFVARR